MSASGLTVGLATKLKVAFVRNGWTEQLIDAACVGYSLDQFRKLLLDHVAIVGKLPSKYLPNPRLKLDVGLAWKLEGALARNGWNLDLVDKACGGDNLGRFRQILLGEARIKEITHIIDCDTPPVIEGSRLHIDQHTRMGQWKWDPIKIKLLEIEEDETHSESWPKGYAIRRQLEGKKVLNVCVLDYLLAHPWLIPDAWKQAEFMHIYFWGTIYRWYGKTHGTKHLNVRCLQHIHVQTKSIGTDDNSYGWTDGGRDLHDYWRNYDRWKDVAAVLE